MNRNEKQQALDNLHREICSDESLPLRECATHCVPGEGNPDADILFVGEAPGQREDELGRPFVGAAGKFLDELIASIGLTREEIFIANLIKHRPPNNRDPLPEEIAAYSPWLEKQIEIIQPKLFVTLGRFSLQYFLGAELSISKIHGEPKRRGSRVIVPMYHPAAALYSGSLRSTLEADFAKIPKVLEMIKVRKNIVEDASETVTVPPEHSRETQASLL